jgi:polar amino acid transport system substrate-binding protein
MKADNFKKTILILTTVLAFVLLAACTAPLGDSSPEVSLDSVRVALAPSGTLRAAINFGNPILANKDAATGLARGVSVDLARELGKRLRVPVELVLYESAGKVVDGIQAGAWDIGFFAIDPARATEIDFTPAYVVIEGAYLVPDNSAITANEQVDQEGVRVVVGRGSAYDLYLARALKRAKLVRAPTSPSVVDLMNSGKYEVAAGVKQQLAADAKRLPGVRLLDGRFMIINQAMATPKGRDLSGVTYLKAFVEEMKSSGFVARALLQHGIVGAAVAPL